MERRFPHIISHSGIAPFAATQPWFLCSGALLCAAAALVRSPLWASLAALLFAAFLVTIARRAPAAFVLLAPMLVLRLTELASGAAIESGAIMSETGVTGEPTGAFARLALLQLVTIAAAALLIERYWPRLRSNFANLAAPGPLMTSAIVGTIGLATLILAALACRHGLPLLGAIDRFTYLKRLDGTPFRTIMMNRIVIAPLVGLLVAAPTSRLLGLWLAAWLVILSITFGEKFTSLLFITAAVAQPLALVQLARSGALPWRPLGLAAGVFLLVSLPAVLITYGAASDPGRAWQRAQDRAAVQGQLWYLADRAGPPRRPDSAAIRADLISWFRPTEQLPERAGTRFGLYHVMSRFTSSHRVGQAIAGNNGFAFALYPYLLLVSGPILLITGALIVTLAQATILLLLAAALAHQRWLAALAFARAANAATATIVTGYLWNLFGVKTLAAILIGLTLTQLPKLGSFRVFQSPLNRKLRKA